jgi:hypothetical protein
MQPFCAMRLLFLQNWAGMRKGFGMIKHLTQFRLSVLGLCLIGSPLLTGCDMFGGAGGDAATITKTDAADVESGTISDDMVVLDDSAVDGTAIDTSAPTPLPGTGPVGPKPATAATDPTKAVDPSADPSAPAQPATTTPASGPASGSASSKSAPALAKAPTPAAPKARTLDQVAKSAADAAKAPPKAQPKAAPKTP